MAIEKPSTRAWLLAALLGWVIFLLPFLLNLARYGTGAVEGFADDTMRMVEVRDLIAGRGWFDHIQPRLGLDGGTFMHWSRLVDAPIAGLILIGAPVLGQAGAETLATIVWPLVLAIVPIAAVAFAAQAHAGLRGAILAAILMAQMLILTSEFDPGSLDHHNVQVALLVTAVCLAVVGLDRPRCAIGAGIATAASVAVGIEALPHLALLGGFLAVYWVARGDEARRMTLNYFVALAATLAVLFVATAPPEGWAGGFCDSFSVDQAVPLLIASLGLAAAAWRLSGRGPGLRALALIAVAALALAALRWITPACLSNPVDQLDPYLRRVWFDQVVEVQPLFKALAIAPTSLVPMVAVWCIAAVSTLVLIARGQNRAAWLIVALMLLASLGMSRWQTRGVLFVGVLSVLPIIGVVELIYRHAEARGRPLLRFGALLLFFVSVPHIWSFAALAFQSARQGPPVESPLLAHLARCFEPEAYAPLAALPPGLVAAGSNLGTTLLLATPHRVLSAPYHRNQAGMMAQFRIDYAEDAEAERMLRELGVDYVVDCRENTEFMVDDGSTPGFSFRLHKGEVPDFLTPEPAGAADALIRVYRLTPPA